jgi:phenylacetate-coenzyme A ligase PaaK-like adenylate-forming protein
MTKVDLMAAWDDAVTDRRLSLDRCERHLERLTGPTYLLDEFQVVVSGGSSGVRGVFVYGWEDWVHAYSSYARWVARARPAMEAEPSSGGMAMIAGGSPSQIGTALAATFASDLIETCVLEVGQPLSHIAAVLDREQPGGVLAPASMLHLLATEAIAGRLSIRPRLVVSAFEPLLPEIVEAVDRAWTAVILNAYGTSDFGPAGFSCIARAGIHLSDDLIIVEPVDDVGRPVPPGKTAPRYYATALRQHTLPIIRYEMTDEVTLIDDPCPCGSAFRRIADIQGRTDDLFRYAGDVVVHPAVFRTPLGRTRGALEYRVLQTARGADVEIRTTGTIDVERLSREIVERLRTVGLPAPQVTVRRVPEIERTGPSRKLKRFVPLLGGGT